MLKIVKAVMGKRRGGGGGGGGRGGGRCKRWKEGNEEKTKDS